MPGIHKLEQTTEELTFLHRDNEYIVAVDTRLTTMMFPLTLPKNVILSYFTMRNLDYHTAIGKHLNYFL